MKKKILIVEDESIVALEIQNRLEQMGYHVIDTISEGEQAIKKALETKPDLVLMDIHLLGEMDGITTAEQIRKKLKIPVIFLTAYADKETLKRARITQPYGYIVKPFEERELQSNIEIALYRHQMDQELQETKNHLESIIENSSEILFTIDQKNKVRTWNKAAEKLTGFTKNEVIGKTIEELNVFSNTEEIHNIISQNTKKHYIERPIHIHFQTKADDNKTIQINQPASIEDNKNKNPAQMLFIGNDVTSEIEKHEQFQMGKSYLLSSDEKNNTQSLVDYFSRLHQPILYITRSNHDTLDAITKYDHVEIALIRKQGSQQTTKTIISDLEGLIQNIQQFCKTQENSIIILHHIDYFIIKNSFKQLMETLYQINDIITDTNNLLIVESSKDTMDKQQQAMMQHELKTLPKKQIQTIELSEGLYTIIKFIQKQRNKGSEVSLKTIKDQLDLSYPTIKIRLNQLEEKGLIMKQKHGRRKTVHISRKGEQLLEQKN